MSQGRSFEQPSPEVCSTASLHFDLHYGYGSKVLLGILWPFQMYGLLTLLPLATGSAVREDSNSYQFNTPMRKNYASWLRPDNNDD